MEIRDEDMQMIRDALASAPEYVKGHFENLVSEHDKAANTVEDLTPLVEKVELLESERDELAEQVKSLEDEANSELRDHVEALESVKYWMHDVMFLGKPMRDPRKILAIVERLV